MAKIDCTLAITSDMVDGLAVNQTMTLNKADSTVGLELTTGLAKRSFTSTNQVDLLTAGSGIAADVTASKSAKLYIKNVGSDSTKYFIIGKGDASGGTTETTISSGGTAYYRIGRLYGGDWMLIPWDAASTTGDITIQPSSATKMDVEYMVFYE
tara:strand:- start:122 stop:583 length:462 start_codon:yes stop_codon:yes gene_type:complete